jgi:hypothetical protein
MEEYTSALLTHHQGVRMESLNGLAAVTITSEGIYDSLRKCSYFGKWMPNHKGQKCYVVGDMFSDHVLVISTNGQLLGNAEREVPLKGHLTVRGTRLFVRGVQHAY